MNNILQLGDTAIFERMPNGRIRIIPTDRLGGRLEERENRVIEFDIDESLRLIKWMAGFTGKK